MIKPILVAIIITNLVLLITMFYALIRQFRNKADQIGLNEVYEHSFYSSFFKSYLCELIKFVKNFDLLETCVYTYDRILQLLKLQSNNTFTMMPTNGPILKFTNFGVSTSILVFMLPLILTSCLIAPLVCKYYYKKVLYHNI